MSDAVAAPPAAGSFKAGPIGKAASILVWIAALGQVALAAVDWRAYAVYKDDIQGWDIDAIRAVDVVLLVAYVAAATTFIIWLRQVRGNAERFCKAPHRRRRGWVIGGWIVPIVNLWFPKQIVDDIVAASTPRTDPQANELPRLRASVVLIWWTAWIATVVIEVAYPIFSRDPLTVGDLVGTAILSTACAVATIVCAVYAVRVIQLINQLQSSRPWVGWWETTADSTSTSQSL